MSDRDLVLAFKRGDPGAAELVAQRCTPWIEGSCRRLMRSYPSDVEDVVQDALWRVFRALPEFGGEYLLKPWVRRVAANSALDAIRRRSRRPEVPVEPASVVSLMDAGASADTPEALVIDAGKSDEVRQVLAGLPPLHARALALRAEERSHIDIAVDLSTTPARAKALLHRARGSFREAWQRAAMVPALIWLVLRRGRGSEVRVAERLTSAAGPSAAVWAPALMGTFQVSERLASTVAAVALAVSSLGVGVVARHSQERPTSAPSTFLASASPSDAGRVAVNPDFLPQPPAVDASRGVAGTIEVGQEVASISPEATSSIESGGAAGRGRTEPVELPPGPPRGGNAIPAFDSLVDVATTSDADCGCDVSPRVVRADLFGNLSRKLDLRHVSRGAAQDAEGDAAWEFWLDLQGSLSTSGGRLDLHLDLDQDGNGYGFDGEAAFTRASRFDSGWIVDLAGHYRSSERLAGSPVPTEGPVRISLIFWDDGAALIDVQVHLG